MDVIEHATRVRTFVEEVWNRRNYEAAHELYSESYFNGFGAGPAARVEPIRRYHEAFPDLHVEIEEVIATADAIVLRSTFHGTDTGGYAGRSPTGRTVSEWVVTIMHFDGDKIAREWVGADKLGLSSNLGWSTTRGRNSGLPQSSDRSDDPRVLRGSASRPFQPQRLDEFHVDLDLVAGQLLLVSHGQRFSWRL